MPYRQVGRVLQPHIQRSDLELLGHLHNHLKQRPVRGKLLLEYLQHVVTVSHVVVYLQQHRGSRHLRVVRT
jgi:hypothetical protein